VAILLLFFLAYGSIDNRWYRVITVEGNSMSPMMHYGDLMVIGRPPENIPLNTVVIMKIDGSFVTHRLIGWDENGRPITQGDANDKPDNFSNPNLTIVGVYRFHIPRMGYLLLSISRMMGRV
jgi:signal peptidase